MAQEWQSNMDTSKKLAAQEDKVIIMVFQGSDWCAPCMRLSREVWEQEAFIAYANDHYVMLQLDFPRKKKNALPEQQLEHNRDLAEIYNPQGYFPHVVLIDSTGATLGETGYKRMTPDEYIAHLNSLINTP